MTRARPSRRGCDDELVLAFWGMGHGSVLISPTVFCHMQLSFQWLLHAKLHAAQHVGISLTAQGPVETKRLIRSLVIVPKGQHPVPCKECRESHSSQGCPVPGGAACSRTALHATSWTSFYSIDWGWTGKVSLLNCHLLPHLSRRSNDQVSLCWAANTGWDCTLVGT